MLKSQSTWASAPPIEDTFSIVEAGAGPAAGGKRPAPGAGLGNLLRIASSAIELVSKDPAVRSSEHLLSLLSAGLSALTQARLLVHLASTAEDTFSIMEAGAGPAAGGKRPSPGAGLGNLLQIASSAIELVSKDPAVGSSEHLPPLLLAGLSALTQAGALVHPASTAGRTAGCRAVSLADLFREMRPRLGRVIDLAGSFQIAICRHLPLIPCNSVALEGAISNLLLYVRRELGSRSTLRLSAASLIDCHNCLGIRIELALTAPKLTIASTGQCMEARRARCSDEIGLATARLFAESLGGRLELDCSTVGRLTIALWLPCSRMPPGGEATSRHHG